jgi:hypothetical protein
MTESLAFVAIVLLSFACERSTKLEVSRPADMQMAPPPAISKSASYNVNESESTTDDLSTRKLIRTGILSVEVGDIAKVKNEVEQICKAAHAYLSSETQSNYDFRHEYQQVIRVPGANFDGLVKSLEALGTAIETKSIETSDVTAEFIDTEARIKAKKALEERYLDILKKATTVKEMLEVEAQLTEVRAELESMEGRIKYLTNQVAYSTLTFSFYQPLKNDYGFGGKIAASLANGWNALLATVIAILSVWPFVLLIAIIYLAVRKIRTRNRNFIQS